MILHPESGKIQLAKFREGLHRAGVKATHQRLEIFREIAGSTEHPDAETIYTGVRTRVPTISLDTVYRTLWLFLDLGLLDTLGPPRERTRFDANMNPHHHFICSRCGATHDFECGEYDQLQIPAAVNRFGRVVKAHVEIRGICLMCSERPNYKTSAKRNKEEK